MDRPEEVVTVRAEGGVAMSCGAMAFYYWHIREQADTGAFVTVEFRQVGGDEVNA